MLGITTPGWSCANLAAYALLFCYTFTLFFRQDGDILMRNSSPYNVHTAGQGDGEAHDRFIFPQVHTLQYNHYFEGLLLFVKQL